MSALSRWMDERVSSLVIGSTRTGEPAVLRMEEMDFYTTPELLDHPERLYRFADTVPSLKWSRSEVLSWGKRQGWSFPSPFAPLNPEYGYRYVNYLENQTVSGFRYEPFKPSRGTLLYLHGWPAPSFWLEEKLIFPIAVGKLGLTVMAPSLPFHMARRPQNSGFSGEFFVSADLVRTLEAFRQSVVDARAVLAWLRQEDGGPVGLVGLSLGALVGALFLGSQASLDMAVLALTPANVAQTFREAPLLHRLRGNLADSLTDQQLERWSPLVNPALLKPLLPRERILFVQGDDDRVSPPEAVKALWNAWGQPELFWYPGGHFGCALYANRVRKHASAFIQKMMP